MNIALNPKATYEFLDQQMAERDERIAALEAESAALRNLVALQTEDEGLWFVARTAPEGYLQQELRRLHAAIETQLFDLAAHQKRMAREYITEERLAAVFEREGWFLYQPIDTDPSQNDYHYGFPAAAILAVLFEEET